MSIFDITHVEDFEQRPAATGFNASPDEDAAGPSLSAAIAAEMDAHFGYGQRISDEEAAAWDETYAKIQASLFEFARVDELLIAHLAREAVLCDALAAEVRGAA